MSKVILTVFTCNVPALAFYRKLGYSLDETSPDYVDPNSTNHSGGSGHGHLQPGSGSGGSCGSGPGRGSGGARCGYGASGGGSGSGSGSGGSGTSSLAASGGSTFSSPDGPGNGGPGYHILSKRRQAVDGTSPGLCAKAGPQGCQEQERAVVAVGGPDGAPATQQKLQRQGWATSPGHSAQGEQERAPQQGPQQRHKDPEGWQQQQQQQQEPKQEPEPQGQLQTGGQADRRASGGGDVLEQGQSHGPGAPGQGLEQDLRLLPPVQLHGVGPASLCGPPAVPPEVEPGSQTQGIRLCQSAQSAAAGQLQVQRQYDEPVAAHDEQQQQEQQGSEDKQQ